MKKRIVVTGLGVVSPAGVGKESFWRGLLTGRSNVVGAPWAESSTTACKKVCAVEKQALPKSRTKVPDEILFALEASREALTEAGLDTQGHKYRIGLALGSVVGAGVSTFKNGIPIPPTHQYDPVHVLSKQLGLTGPLLSVPAACAAGVLSIVQAMLMIQDGRADVMLAGGFDALAEVSFAGFSSLNLLTKDCVRPFDRDRSGFFLAEGAGVLAIESLESAQKRNASIYGEIRGFGLGADAFHVIHPHPKAEGLIKAMVDALNMAGCIVDEVDYVNSHGTATRVNDKSESLALNALFSQKSANTPTSSFKSVLGHTMGAAGAIETIGCLLALKHKTMPPTWNFQTKDPECEVDCIPNCPRETSVRTIVKNSSGFGGTNGSLVISC